VKREEIGVMWTRQEMVPRETVGKRERRNWLVAKSTFSLVGEDSFNALITN
jgi:hypothetical protein